VVEVYTLGSLAHGGFSQIYSDIDVGVILSCPNPPVELLDHSPADAEPYLRPRFLRLKEQSI
jgi:predicted nucleotidyltransferase